MDAANSAGGFLGIGPGGPNVKANTANQALDQTGRENGIYDTGGLYGITGYGNGTMSLQDAMNQGSNQEGEINALATNPLTGSKMATEQVQNNGILGGLFGQDGQLNKANSKLDSLNSQGFELKPEDMTLYGQTSGNIARMFGAQGNQVSQDLASRGLASAPSGAAGAMFSGLAGNQNEMLASAQQQIMQQRFQNTQNQIAQTQNFVSQLGQQGANAINSQYDRNMSGVQNHQQGLSNSANSTTMANSANNQAEMAANQFNAENKPMNFMDYATAGLGQGIQAGMGGGAASMFGMKPASKTPANQDNGGGTNSGGGPNPTQMAALMAG